MPGEITPQLKEYLDYQDTVKGRPQDAETLLTLFEKARMAGLAKEAELHLHQAGRLYPADPRVRERLRQELGPDRFAKWEAEHAGEKPFWTDLGAILRYPASPGALMMLAAAAFGLSLGRILEDLMALLPWLKIFSVPAFMLGGLAWFTMAVILPGFFRTLVWKTASGQDDFPEWPGLVDPWGQIVLPTLKSLLVLMWSFLPLTLVLTAAIRSGNRPSLALLLLSLVYGCLYFPISFLMTSVSGKLWPSFLPSNVVEAAAKAFSSYLKLVPIFWLFVLPSMLLTVLWPVPFIGALIPAFAGLYCWAAAMRLLGRFYRLEAGSLEWM
jgi:hypothetical protein